MKLSDFDYYLPEELIAQDPLEKRDSSRLMCVERVWNVGDATGSVDVPGFGDSTGSTRVPGSVDITHRTFSDLPGLLKPGDCLVMNDTKVIPARLYGQKKDTGAAVEILLLKRITDTRWECIVRPGKKLRPGAEVSFGSGELTGVIDSVKDDGNRIIEFSYEGIFEEILDRLGIMPLPPYIKHELKDRDRYQTVYAKYEGSAAAPTAGLHFTNELLDEIAAMGVDIAKVTLHVGLGTFRPVKEENVLNHKMHSEHYSISKEAADKINAAKDEGRRIICVGTTSVRTIESAASDDGHLEPGSGDTEIFIYPGYKFKIVDGLITNFHLPKSTLIMLVSALAGRENVLQAYEEAVNERYRFFSFGDAMFIY